MRISDWSSDVCSSDLINDKLRVGDVLDVSAPRGNFTLRPGGTPVVFLSGGIGATPVLAMLHVLAAEESSREVWWFYGARNRSEHPFSGGAGGPLQPLAHRSEERTVGKELVDPGR